MLISIQMGAYQVRKEKSREKEDLKRRMLNEQGRGGKQPSFSVVMGPYLSRMPDPATAVVA